MSKKEREVEVPKEDIPLSPPGQKAFNAVVEAMIRHCLADGLLTEEESHGEAKRPILRILDCRLHPEEPPAR
jgi:hypothetical protein